MRYRIATALAIIGIIGVILATKMHADQAVQGREPWERAHPPGSRIIDYGNGWQRVEWEGNIWVRHYWEGGESILILPNPPPIPKKVREL